MKLTRKVYADDKEKRSDFWRGFWLWWAGNIVLSILTGGLTFLGALLPSTMQENMGLVTALTWICSLLPFVINVGVIVLLALTRSQMALGMLAAFAVAFAVVLVLGVILAVVCFVIIAASGSGATG